MSNTKQDWLKGDFSKFEADASWSQFHRILAMRQEDFAAICRWAACVRDRELAGEQEAGREYEKCDSCNGAGTLHLPDFPVCWKCDGSGSVPIGEQETGRLDSENRSAKIGSTDSGREWPCPGCDGTGAAYEDAQCHTCMGTGSVNFNPHPNTEGE